MSAAGFPDALRPALAHLADAIVPATERMPAASAVDVHGRWIDRVVAARPDLFEPIERVLGAARLDGDAHAEAQRLEREDGAGFAALVLAVTGAYVMAPRVRKLIGYPGQVERPPYPDEFDYDLRDGLLDPVLARGPIWRSAG